MKIPAIPRRTVCLYKGWIKDSLNYLFSKDIKNRDHVKRFERLFSDYSGISFCFSVYSGRVGFDIILTVCGLNAGDEVILPAYTDESIVNVLIKRGITPVFVDIKKTDHTIDPCQIEEKITEKTKAIVATHLFGELSDMNSIKAVSKKNSLFIIEDCAHAFGTPGAGAFGDISFFSLADSKPYTTFKGGVVCTNSKVLAEKIELEVSRYPEIAGLPLLGLILPCIIQYILVNKIFFTIIVYPFFLLLSSINMDISEIYKRTFKAIDRGKTPYRFSNYQAWIGYNAIKPFERHMLKRKQNVKILLDTLLPNVKRLCKKLDLESNLYFFIIVTEARAGLAGYLLWSGIDTGSKIMRHCPSLFDFTGSFPVTDFIYNNSIQIPVDHTISSECMRRIGNSINMFFNR